MAFNLEIKYYNSFWLKQNSSPLIALYNTGGGTPARLGQTYAKVFPGIPGLNYSNDGFPNFPANSGGAMMVPYSNAWPLANQTYNVINGSNWIVEESRIRGGFNNTQVELGPRAYLKEDSNDVRHRSSSLIYSGIFNSRTNINETNVFSVGQDITRTIDPHNGSVQLIHALDNNLAIFQENKVSQALIDKDAIYSTEGNQTTALTTKVIGPVTPYIGDYGISRNPESFAEFGFRRYFADKDRNAIIRLSKDGITPISNYGMKDYFRDELVKISEGQVVYSDPVVPNYSNTTGRIIQGPDDFSSVLQDSPNFLGVRWFEILVAGGVPEDIFIGSQVQLNTDFTNNPDAFVNLSTFVIGTGVYVDNSGLYPINRTVVYTRGNAIPVNATGLDIKIRFKFFRKDRIVGGYDNYKSNYIVSLQKFTGSKTDDELSDNYNTVAFDESVQGWVTFYTYRPELIFSMKNNMYTTKYGVLYRHYDSDLVRTNHNNFYGVDNDSSIEFIFNNGPSIGKNFKTISYEGSSGWQIDSMQSDGMDNNGIISKDITLPVKSYVEGLYTDQGIQYRAGFNRKGNKYVANLVNNTPASPEEVNFGSSITGIKGFFATVNMSTDATTNFGGAKELFAVSTEFSPIQK